MQSIIQFITKISITIVFDVFACPNRIKGSIGFRSWLASTESYTFSTFKQITE